MPERDPYGVPIMQPPPVVVVKKDTDRGPDVREVIAQTLKIVESWGQVSLSDIIADVALMQPDDPDCALCGEPDCESGCPLTRWRGQA